MNTLATIFFALMLIPTNPRLWTLDQWGKTKVTLKGPNGSKTQPFYFDFPVGDSNGSSAVGYFTTKPTGGGGSQLVITLQVFKDAGVTFNANLQPDNQAYNCYYPIAKPAIVVPYLEHADAWTAAFPSPGQYYRWFAPDYAVALDSATGLTQITVPLDPAKWMSVYGAWGNEAGPAAQAFNETVAAPVAVGLTFGGGCYLSHGVNATGNARFVLWNFYAE